MARASAYAPHARMSHHPRILVLRPSRLCSSGPGLSTASYLAFFIAPERLRTRREHASQQVFCCFLFSRMAVIHWIVKTISPLALVRLVAMAALCLQVILPAPGAFVQANGAGVAHFLCSPSGAVPNAEAIAALKAFADLTGEHDPDEQQQGDHCPLCSLGKDVDPPLWTAIGAQPQIAGGQVIGGFDARFARDSRGPPLGSRAPPSHA